MPDFVAMRQCCHLANPPKRSVRRKQTSHHEDAVNIDSKKDESLSEADMMLAICDIEQIEPVAPYAGVGLQCRRVQLGIARDILAEHVGLSTDSIYKIELGLETTTHEIWQLLVAATAQTSVLQ